MNTISSKLAVALVAALLCGQSAWAEMISFSVPMSPGEEVPAVSGSGKGKLAATLDTATARFTWKISYSDLSGPVTSAHFHGPAGRMEKAGVAVGIKGNLSSPIQGEATLTPDQVKELMAGKWYVNLHTEAHPPGELRGQITR